MSCDALLLIVLLGTVGISQNTSNDSTLVLISDIVNNPGRFSDEFLKVEGIVTQYTPGSANSTAYYLLKGDFGGVIKVNTNEERPVTNEKYRVEGTVVIDMVNQEAYLIEKRKSKVIDEEEFIDTDGDGVEDDLDDCPDEKGTIKNNGCPEDYTLYYIGGGVLLLLILIVIYFRQKNKSAASSYPSGGFTSPKDSSFTAPGTSAETVKIENSSTDFQTIKIETDSAPKTMKLLPGYLEITAGADKGKKFSISGYPTPDGSVITIGRETVTGERKYAHIQLKEPTVSRKQAEIRAIGGKLEIKNLSTTNLTQLNGVEIQPNHKMELEPDSTIKTGEVEFTYRK